MSKIALTPSATGTGVFSILSPATNTDRTLTLPDETSTLAILGANTFTGAQTFSLFPAISALSYVRLNTANGYGSTNDVIRRFTNTVNNVGTDITYSDSATLGASFTINTNGVYAISYTDQFSAVSYVGISLNTTQFTTSIADITQADILVFSNVSGANSATTSAITSYFASGSVIRAHTDSRTSGTLVKSCQFTIARVA